jgi:hypothetical protein
MVELKLHVYVHALLTSLLGGQFYRSQIGGLVASKANREAGVKRKITCTLPETNPFTSVVQSVVESPLLAELPIYYKQKINNEKAKRQINEQGNKLSQKKKT